MSIVASAIVCLAPSDNASVMSIPRLVIAALHLSTGPITWPTLSDRSPTSKNFASHDPLGFTIPIETRRAEPRGSVQPGFIRAGRPSCDNPALLAARMKPYSLDSRRVA